MSLQNKQTAHNGGGECARRGRCYPNVTDGCEQRRRKVTRWSEEENEGRAGEVTHPFEDTQSEWEAGLGGCYGVLERGGCWVRVSERKQLGLGGRAVI